MNKTTLADEDLPLACLQVAREAEEPFLVPGDVADELGDRVSAGAVREALRQLERDGVADSYLVNGQTRIWYLDQNLPVRDDLEAARQRRRDVKEAVARGD